MRNGFTLIEVLVVVVIIGLIASIVAVNVGSKTDPAKVKLTVTTLKQVKSEAELFKVNHNRYPGSLQDLVRMPPYVNPKSWPVGGYMDEVPKDAWGNELRYHMPGRRGPFDIVSLGEDGKEGGEGYAEDLYSSPIRE